MAHSVGSLDEAAEGQTALRSHGGEAYLPYGYKDRVDGEECWCFVTLNTSHPANKAGKAGVSAAEWMCTPGTEAPSLTLYRVTEGGLQEAKARVDRRKKIWKAYALCTCRDR